MLVERHCLACGRPFHARPNDIARGRRACSRRCGQRCARPRRRPSLAERFWRHVLRTEDCWLWTGVPNRSGRGVLAVRDGGRVVRRTAPRVSWELHYGPLPAGRRIAHRCRRPICVRPDHLYLVRGRLAREHVKGTPAPTLATPARRNGHFATGRLARGRTWWTRQRVLAGLRRFVEDTGQTPIASPRYARLARSRARSPRRRRYPSAYAILRHFPTLRAAWEAVGVTIADRRRAAWSPAEDWYVREALGVLSTATIAVDLGRGEAAVHAHAHLLGLHVTDVWG